MHHIFDNAFRLFFSLCNYWCVYLRYRYVLYFLSSSLPLDLAFLSDGTSHGQYHKFGLKWLGRLHGNKFAVYLPMKLNTSCIVPMDLRKGCTEITRPLYKDNCKCGSVHFVLLPSLHNSNDYTICGHCWYNCVHEQSTLRIGNINNKLTINILAHILNNKYCWSLKPAY